MNKRTAIMIGVLLLGLCSSCNSKIGTNPSQVETGKLIVYLPAEANSFKPNALLTVAIENNSKDPIALLPNNAVALFMTDGGQWVNVDNLMVNSIPKTILLSSVDHPDSNGTTIPVLPKVPKDQIVDIRIEVTGIVVNSQQKITAYTDVTLAP